MSRAPCHYKDCAVSESVLSSMRTRWISLHRGKLTATSSYIYTCDMPIKSPGGAHLEQAQHEDRPWEHQDHRPCRSTTHQSGQPTAHTCERHSCGQKSVCNQEEIPFCHHCSRRSSALRRIAMTHSAWGQARPFGADRCVVPTTGLVNKHVIWNAKMVHKH
jgi:hypothetical protein